MVGTPVEVIIRAIPKGGGFGTWGPAMIGPGEQYFKLTGLPWDTQKEIRAELDNLGYFVQDIHLGDPMPVLVGVEIRKRFEEEDKKAAQ